MPTATPSPATAAAANRNTASLIIAIVAILAIATHLILRFAFHTTPATYQLPLWVALVGGGAPLVYGLLVKAIRLDFGSDLLAGISIVTSILVGEYLAGSIVVLMLSGGEALEGYAIRNASSALRALAGRMPNIAHRRDDDRVTEVALDAIVPGDLLVLFPHDICPVDGVVVEGHGAMDEAFVTGEPFRLSKAPGATVISGAINGDTALTIRASRPAADSRYAKIVAVMQRAEEERPRMRRLGDQLGAYYTPLALAIAVAAWVFSGQSGRFLAVLVVATPCPLLIAIPVAIIGAISLCARRAIIIKDPSALEQIAKCRTAIFDKTGTLTYGRPNLTEQVPAPGIDARTVLGLVASIERYSKHPLASAILDRADQSKVAVHEASHIHEPPGQGVRGTIDGHTIEITSRKKLAAHHPDAMALLPPATGGLECFILLDGRYAAAYRFRDEPRGDGASFISHLKPQHQFDRVVIVSGDRDSEVQYLANLMGITNVYAEQTPEQKVQIVRAETERTRTLYVGDGINDAPALTSATVGIAIGNNSDVTTEAADVVIMDSSLAKVDEFMHISQRMRRIALQSAIGGIALSLLGMIAASLGLLSPVEGAIAQEVIDVLAVLNALRAAVTPRNLTDMGAPLTTRATSDAAPPTQSGDAREQRAAEIVTS